HPQYHLIRYSAKSEKSLEQYEQQLLAFLESNQEEDLARIAYTLQAGRTTFAHGKYLIANRVTDLLEQLKQQSPKMNRRAEKERIAFMFSGQGSQYVKMGKGLYEEHQTFRQIMDQGFAFLQKDQGLDYRKIWLAETSNLIHETQHTQPILFLLEYALARFLMDLGLRPNYLIGHSLGEYVAACLSGVFSFEDGLRLIGKRASLMASMEGGSMLSVGGNYAQMDQQLIAGLALAAVNSPDSFVLSGSDKAVRAVKSRLEKAEITCRLLKTSHAFHSDLMNGMLDAFNNFLNTIELSSPNLPFVSNVTGEWIQPEEATSPEYWAQHVVQPVQFAKGMQFLIEQNHTLFIEVGPGKTLTTFYKQSQDLSKNNAACYSLRHPKELLADGAHWAKFLGQLWTHGLDIDWSTFYQDQVPQKMNLPTYVFDAYELPTKVSVDDHLKLAGQAAPGKKEMEECFYLPLWKQEHFLTQKATGKIETKNCLFFSDGGVFCRKVRQALIDEGKHVIEVKMGVTFEELTNEQIQIDPQDLTHFQQLAATLTQRDFDPQQFLYAWGLEAQQTSEPETYRTFLLHFNCIRSILEGFQLWEGTTKKKFVLFHHQMASVIGNEQNNDLREFENVLLKVLSQENPLLFTSSIDLDVNQPHTRLIQSILTELARDASNMRVAFRNGKRWIPTYAPVFPDTSQPSCLQTNGRYLFVGDFGDTAFFLAQYLLKNYRAQLAFIGPQWSEQGPQLLDRTQKEQQIQLEQRWEILKRGGGQLYCIPCQQLEKAHLSEAVRKAETYLGTIDGIIHDARGSGAGMGTLLAHVEDQAIESHFAPLVNGLLGLQQIFKDRTLDFAIVLSSLSSFLGGITYGSYAAANALMDEILLAKQEPFNHWRCLNLDRISEKGDKWIKGRELVTIFEHAFQFADLPQLIVSKRPIDQPELLHPAKNERPKPKVNIDRTTMKVAFKAPVTETEGELLVLFESMFSMEGIGVEDDFFELGGDSLKGMMLINKISKSFGVKCAIADLFANASITDLAGLIDERQWLQADKEMANELVL
ncbi:MAG: acyltransferase domain-containing protein, partial [Bacteroidota bacterium]